MVSVLTKITDEQLIEELENGISLVAIADKYKINYRTLRCRKQKLVLRGFAPEVQMKKLYPEEYTVTGVSQYCDSDGNVIKQWVKTNINATNQLESIKEAIEVLVKELPQENTIAYIKGRSDIDRLYNDCMTVYPLGDPHIGMLSWEPESGQSWDLAIATKMFTSIFQHIVSASPKTDEATIVNLGDFFHYDNIEGVTSRSHNSLDIDGRYAKMIQVGMQLMRTFINITLLHHKTVRVVNVIGNHDDTGAIFLAIALKHIYENNSRVIIDDAPTAFHYIRYGKVLIGVHHGHTCKMSHLPSVMAADRSKDWGETEYRYWLTGHIHHDSKIEAPGCMVESFRTLAAKDAYAVWGGWRSGQDTKSIVYHKEFGEVQRYTAPIKLMQVPDNK